MIDPGHRLGSRLGFRYGSTEKLCYTGLQDIGCPRGLARTPIHPSPHKLLRGLCLVEKKVFFRRVIDISGLHSQEEVTEKKMERGKKKIRTGTAMVSLLHILPGFC
jgi:hypothetical protein